jgi:hypothetical protein
MPSSSSPVRQRWLRLAGPAADLSKIDQQLQAQAPYLQELRLSCKLEEAPAAATELIGLDGSVKLRASRLVPLSEIFRMIEAMPMRCWEK